MGVGGNIGGVGDVCPASESQTVATEGGEGKGKTACSAAALVALSESVSFI